MVDLSDTICALATAHGRSGIAVVRMSGPAAFAILAEVFHPAGHESGTPDRRARYGRLADPFRGGHIDESLVTCFHAPRSYTGEDVVELSVHGSPVVVQKLIASLCAGGARLAEPGEFTLRAYVNGRMDLAQAEAVRDIVEAQTWYQHQLAARQRSGELSRRLEGVKRTLIDSIVRLESAVEFVEDDLEPQARDSMVRELTRLGDELSGWVKTFRRGRLVREGFSLAIVGRPNAGKSSLFNALLSEERSIVTEIPGTTRDLVSESADIGGIPVRLIDTAGIRNGGDAIERLGVEKTRRIMADADAVLLVVDVSRPRDAEDDSLLKAAEGFCTLVAWNKTDLLQRWRARDKEDFAPLGPGVEVSALTGAGLDALSRAIEIRLAGDESGEREGVLVTNVRHCRCLEKAQARVEAASKSLRGGLSEEFALVDLHRALDHLGEITGATSVEEILDEIFGRFCIGK